MDVNKNALRLIGGLLKGKGEKFPEKADFEGQMFIKTGSSAGLYVSVEGAWAKVATQE